MQVSMASVEASQEVGVPLRTAYNQWTQFETFPEFMEGIESVNQITNDRVRFTGDIYGKKETWEARIVQQERDHRISWVSEQGARNDGTVRFEPVDPGTTRIHVRIEFEPESFVEKVGDALGVVDARVKGDLRRFKEFIEDRGAAEGGWRGEIHTMKGRTG
jgi:uncharacterized membrane protein